MIEKVSYEADKIIRENTDFSGNFGKYCEFTKEFDTIYSKIVSKEIEDKCDYYRKLIKGKEDKEIYIVVTVVAITLILMLLPVMAKNLTILLLKIMPNILNYIVITFIVICAIGLNYSDKEYYKKFENIENYWNYYKNNVVPNTVKSVNNNLIYEKEASSDLIETYIQVYENNAIGWREDYIYGKIHNNQYIEMAKINSGIPFTPTTTADKLGKFFYGMFVTFNLNKNINGSIKIIPDNSLLIKGEGKVNFDSITFEEYFDVYASDKILSMCILTADTMELLVNIYKKYHFGFDIYLKDDKAYIRVFSDDSFEPTLNKDLEKHKIYYDYNVLKVIIELSENIMKIIDNTEI